MQHAVLQPQMKQTEWQKKPQDISRNVTKRIAKYERGRPDKTKAGATAKYES